MADSSVPISGTALLADTRTDPNGEHRQVMVLGDPAAANVAGVDTAGRVHVNIAGSAGLSPSAAASLTAAAAANISGTGNTTGSVVLDVSAAGNASFHLFASAAFNGTLVFEQSFDPAGAAGTWAAVPVLPEDGLSAPMSQIAINTATAYVRQFTGGMFGPSLFRVRCSVFTSGSIAVLARGGPGWVETQPALAPSVANIGMVDLACATAATTVQVTTSGTANTSTQVVAPDATRKSLMLRNASTAPILLNFGSTATTTTLYTVSLSPGIPYEVPPQWAKLAVQAQSSIASAALIVAAGTGL